MKKITWLHVSDWHQTGEEFGRKVVRDQLIKDIKERSEISPDLAEIDFIIFSGDLAYSGKKQEYEAAQKYLLDPVLDATGLKPDKLFFVPGNHDCDRSKIIQSLRSGDAIKSFNSNDEVNNFLEDTDKLDEILKPFQDYQEFITKYNNQNQPEYGSSRILRINGEKIGLLGINSALMTARNKNSDNKITDQGFLVVGEPQIYEFLNSEEDYKLKIAVLHHPFDWLTEFDRKLIKRRLGEYCDFILCGHEHSSKVDRISGTNGDYVFIPAGASYDRSDYPNSYNFVNLDLEKGEGIIFLRRWSRDRTKWIKNEDSYDNGLFKIQNLPKKLGLSDTKNISRNSSGLPRKLNIQELRQLSDAFLRCQSIQNPQSRKDIISNLRQEISNNMTMEGNANQVVLSLIKTSRCYSGGLAQVLESVEFYENDSLDMQNLRQAVRQILPEEFKQ